MNKIIISVVSIGITACAYNSGVVPMGKDTYMLSNTSTTAYASGTQMLAKLYQQAAIYCGERNLTVQPIRETSKDGAPYQKANAMLQFRCLADGDHELRRPTMENTPDVIIQGR